MKRLLAALAVTPLALMALAGPATAARPDVTHLNDESWFAEAGWSSESGDLVTYTYASARTGTGGTELNLSQGTFDPEDPSSGTVETTATASSGFTFTISNKLSSATLVAEDLPVKTCTLDEFGEPIGDCTFSTVDVMLTWTGQGVLTRGSYSDRIKGDGFSMNVHMTWQDRDATVTGDVSGFDLDTAHLDWAYMHHEKQVKTGRCVGEACEGLEPPK